MSNVSSEKNAKTFFVRSLEDVKRISSCYGKTSLRYLPLYVYVSMLVFAANSFLRVAKFLLFKKGGSAHDEFNRIVVYTVGILGDTVAILPTLSALRNRYPKANITVINNCQIWSSQAASELVGNSPFVDHLIIVKDLDCPVQRHGWRFTLDVTDLKKISCDLFVNLSPFGNRGWLGAVAREMILAKKLGAGHAIGFRINSYSRHGTFKKVYHLFVKNEPRRFRDVLSELGIVPVENMDVLPCDSDARQRVLEKLREKGVDGRILFVMNPGAKFKAQCWPAERFGEVARWIASKYGATVAVTGVSSERMLAEKVENTSGGTAINIAGETTIQELVELLRIAKGCVTNDTGTMHLAAMVGVPTVALFSFRQSPSHWLPLGSRVVSLFSPVECGYCYNDECEDRGCLSRIGTEDVIHALEEVLAQPSSNLAKLIPE